MQGALSRTADLQEQLSSLRRVQRPADDPAAATAAMALRSKRRADEQYLRNGSDATGRMNTADQALQQLSDRIRRVRELAVQSGSGALSGGDRATIAAEITAIRGDVIDLFNTRWLDRPVFGGTVAGGDAVDTGGVYIGDDGAVETRISRDATVRVDVKGSDVGADTLPGVLATVAANVVSDPAALAGDLDALDAELDKVLTGLGDLGARAARVGSTIASVEVERLNFTARISENEDADIPETIMRLQSQQVAYQTALAAASKILSVSLADFLR